MIIAQELTKTFGGETVLDRLDLAIESGGIHGLLGRNGVGKSTLLSLIAGQLKPSDGELDVFNQKPFDNATVMDRVSLTGVDVAYPGAWSVRDILTGAQLRYPGWDRGIADDLVADFALDDAMTTAYIQLSRGRQHRRSRVGRRAHASRRTLRRPRHPQHRRLLPPFARAFREWPNVHHGNAPH